MNVEESEWALKTAFARPGSELHVSKERFKNVVSIDILFRQDVVNIATLERSKA